LDVCCPPKIGGGPGLSKVLHPHYHPCLAARRLEKFREDTPTANGGASSENLPGSGKVLKIFARSF